MDIKLNDLVCIVSGNFLMLALFLLFLTGYDAVGIFLCLSAWASAYAAHFLLELCSDYAGVPHISFAMQWASVITGFLAFIHGMVSLAT